LLSENITRSIIYIQRIRGFMTMHYINLHFTYLHYEHLLPTN